MRKPRPRTQNTENYRARRWCENQLSTAAPRDSSTLRSTPRTNALAKCTCKRQEPRTAPAEVVQRTGAGGTLIGPGSSKKRTKYTPFVVALALILPSVQKPSLHRGAVAAERFCARNAAVAVCQESLAIARRTFPLCSTNSHPAVQAIGLALLIRSARTVTQYLVAKKLEVHFPVPGRSRKTLPVRLGHHRDDPTSTAMRLAYGDRFHFEPLKRNRNLALVTWYGGGLSLIHI